MAQRREKLRGDGFIYQRPGSQFLWAQYYRNGKLFRESTKTGDIREAEKFLRARLEQAKRPEFVGPKENRLTLDDLEKKLELDYIRHERRSWATVKYCLKAVRNAFQYDRLIEISTQLIEKYQQDRLEQGMARATVNREIRYLLHGFRLLFDAGQISYVPRVKLLEGENVREGFLNRPEFNALCEHLNEDNRDIVRFLYLSAWRSSEAMTLTWDKVDLSDWVIRLSRKNDKTKRPRVLALVGELADIVNRCHAKRLTSCPYVFHRRGKPIKTIRRQWNTAAVAVGLGHLDEQQNYSGITPHDLRRSAVRNMIKAGITETVGMSISGHTTNSTYKRYAIIDESVQREALERAQLRQLREIERKVVPIKKLASASGI